MRLRITIFAFLLLFSGGVGPYAHAAGIHDATPQDAPAKASVKRVLRHRGLALLSSFSNFLQNRFELEFGSRSGGISALSLDRFGGGYSGTYATDPGNVVLGGDALRDELLSVEIRLTQNATAQQAGTPKKRHLLGPFRPSLRANPNRVQLRLKANW